MSQQSQQILTFWFQELTEKDWFKGGETVDEKITNRFHGLWEMGGKGALDHWQVDASGALALVILLDQFPRNMFRGKAKAFSTDAKALQIAEQAIGQGFDMAIADTRQRTFFYMPLEHAEDLKTQDRCVDLLRERGGTDSHIGHAVAHRDVIARFGRFPHRNDALGRAWTEEERHFINGGGYVP